MRLLTRILEPKNLFTEPPFWSQPRRLFTSMTGAKETIGNDFVGYVRDVYKANGPIFTCVMVRMLIFSEIRYLWQEMNEGRPGSLFANSELDLLEEPWVNGTQGELLAGMEVFNSLAGNYYGARIEDRDGRRIRELRPDAVTIITGSPTEDPFDYRARPVGYVYDPRKIPGSRHGTEPVLFTPEQIIHHKPLKDPDAQWRGMSWLTPVLDEIKGDKAATKHKLKFFENGTVTGLTIKYDPSISVEDFQEYVRLFEEEHGGLDNAYKALHIGGGGDPKTVGANMKQLDFKVTQGAGEARIAAASGLGAVMAQFSEGLAGSSLNTGNFTAARKRAETILFRPLWRFGAGALQSVLEKPENSRLWYDARDVAFLRDDAKEEAEIRNKDSSTFRQLTDSGWTPESVQKAILADDWSLLEHSGLFSVQLQRPGTNDAENRISVPPQAAADLIAAGWMPVNPAQPTEEINE